MASENPNYNEKIPSFDTPVPFLSPQIQNLIKDDNFLYEDGTSYVGYKRCNPDDASEVLKGGGKSLNFVFQESSAFVNRYDSIESPPPPPSKDHCLLLKPLRTRSSFLSPTPPTKKNKTAKGSIWTSSSIA